LYIEFMPGYVHRMLWSPSWHRPSHIRHLLVGSVLMSGLVAMSPAVYGSAAAISTCSSSQLTVAVASDSGAYSAAGNHGFPLIIVNTSKSTCRLKGYPRISFYPSSYKGRSVKSLDGGGMIFVSVAPRWVVLRPGYTASFGVDYGDAYDQQDPNRGPCMTQSAQVSLPVRSHPYSVPFNTALEFNFCFAGFSVTVTSIQSGPIPRQA
jgi:hypothetical protein